MGLEAIYRKPRTSVAQRDHHVYPYLLGSLTIDRPDQVWCAGHHLHSVVGRLPVPGRRHGLGQPPRVGVAACRTRWTPASASRRWRRRFRRARRRSSTRIQGAQFTSAVFTERVQAAGAQCSMDGRGRCLDNVFIERLWRSLKYEAVYLHELADGFAAERMIAAWMTSLQPTNARTRRSAYARRPKSTARSGRRESPNNEPFGQLRHGPRSSEHDPCATRDLVGVGRTRRPRGLDFATGIHLTEALDLSK